MRKLNHWMKLAPAVALAIVTGACVDQSPTEVQGLLEPASASLATSSGPVVAEVMLFPRKYTMDVGQVKQMVALPKNANGKTLSTVNRPVLWSSTKPDVATVDSNGRVRAMGGGTTYIEATFDGVSSRSPITVRAPVQAATISIGSLVSSLQVGNYAQLTAAPKDASGDPVSVPLSWSSSNPAVLRVFSNGLVEARSAGSATITVSGGGVTGRIAITATELAPEPTPPPTTQPGSDVASVAVFPFSTTLSLGQGKQMIALPRSASGTTLSGKTPTWKSSNTAVATVSSTGLVIAKSTGVTTITATVEGTVGTSAITVTP